ncbi:MAG: EcsC family protein [Spirochaetota bacterium]|nr:EcsC family protein [Spirochaetota bacterium]
MTISENDIDELKYAKDLLENPGFAAKITNVLGSTIEKGFDFVPIKMSEIILHAARESLMKALEFAVITMDDRKKSSSSNFFHKMSVAATGAIGGAFGLPALGVELPVSTIIMLRSIADIARSEGEMIKSIETKLSCLQVFALGGESNADDATDSGYFMLRSALAYQVTEASKYIIEKGIYDKGAPAIIRLISTIASRYGVNISKKIAAQAVPVVGAGGGALINTIFINHYQDMARGHFIVRRLERIYGTEAIQLLYEKL